MAVARTACTARLADATGRAGRERSFDLMRRDGYRRQVFLAAARGGAPLHLTVYPRPLRHATSARRYLPLPEATSSTATPPSERVGSKPVWSAAQRWHS